VSSGGGRQAGSAVSQPGAVHSRPGAVSCWCRWQRQAWCAWLRRCADALGLRRCADALGLRRCADALCQGPERAQGLAHLASRHRPASPPAPPASNTASLQPPPATSSSSNNVRYTQPASLRCPAAPSPCQPASHPPCSPLAPPCQHPPASTHLHIEVPEARHAGPARQVRHGALIRGRHHHWPPVHLLQVVQPGGAEVLQRGKAVQAWGGQSQVTASSDALCA
jgi:hypothetical protein